MAFRQGINHADTAFLRIGGQHFRERDRPMWTRCGPRRCWAARSGSIRFARLWMRRRAPLHGARWREDKPLLDTVVNLTEFPSAILGSFDPQFLTLPEEVLVTVMRDHQKYFAVEDASRQTAAAFSGGAQYR